MRTNRMRKWNKMKKMTKRQKKTKWKVKEEVNKTKSQRKCSFSIKKKKGGMKHPTDGFPLRFYGYALVFFFLSLSLSFLSLFIISPCVARPARPVYIVALKHGSQYSTSDPQRLEECLFFRYTDADSAPLRTNDQQQQQQQYIVVTLLLYIHSHKRYTRNPCSV